MKLKGFTQFVNESEKLDISKLASLGLWPSAEECAAEIKENLLDQLLTETDVSVDYETQTIRVHVENQSDFNDSFDNNVIDLDWSVRGKINRDVYCSLIHVYDFANGQVSQEIHVQQKDLNLDQVNRSIRQLSELGQPETDDADLTNYNWAVDLVTDSFNQAYYDDYIIVAQDLVKNALSHLVNRNDDDSEENDSYFEKR